MQTFTFDELSERAQSNAVNLYYADADYQDFVQEMHEKYPEEIMMVSDWARERGVRFNEHGERIA